MGGRHTTIVEEIKLLAIFLRDEVQPLQEKQNQAISNSTERGFIHTMRSGDDEPMRAIRRRKCQYGLAAIHQR